MGVRMKRSFKIKATGNCGDIHTEVTVRIKVTPGMLTSCEANNMKKVAADQFMAALRTIPFFTPHLCDMKVS